MKKALLIIILAAFASFNIVFAEDPPTIVWDKVYNSGEPDIPDGGVAVDAMGNVYVAGRSFIGTGYDYRTIKYDSEGNIQWNKVHDGGDEAYDVAVDAEANVYVTGHSNDVFRTIKYDSEGDILWIKGYSAGGGGDRAYGVAVDALGNVYVTGYSNNGTDLDFRTIKYDSDGNLQWNKVYDSGDRDFPCGGVAVDAEACVYVTGYSDNGTDMDFRTIKYDSDGNLQWNKVYNSGKNDAADGVAVDALAYVYVTGYSHNGTNGDYRTIKYDSDGSLQWNRVYDSGDDEVAYGVAVDAEAYVYVTGRSNNVTDSDYRTIKYDSDGSIQWNKVYDSGDDDVADGVAVDATGYVYVTGHFHNGTDYDFRTIKYEQHVDVAEQPSSPSSVTLEVADNLTNTPTLNYSLSAGQKGTLTFYSADGRKLELYKLDPAQTTFTWSTNNPAGVYFARLDTENGSISQKLLIVK